jgi:hypothetical protein
MVRLPAGYAVGATTICERTPARARIRCGSPRGAAGAGQFPGYAGPADRKAAGF